MVNIDPYQYQKVTNIKEHNDIVAKINEVIDVINNTNLDTVIPKIDKLEQDVSAINTTDSLQWNDIETVKTDIDTINPKIAKMEQDITTINEVDTTQSNDINAIKAKNNEQDDILNTHTIEIDGISKSLVSNVVLMNGTSVGNMKIRVEREDAPSIDSNDYNIQKPTSIELIQGSAPAMVKAQITLSDGTVLVSDDFMFTTEAIGQDVYISSFVFKNGNVAGTISADIGLSNGTTLEANNFAIPTDPSIVSSIEDIRSSLDTKADLSNDLQTIKARAFIARNTSCVNVNLQNLKFIKTNSNNIGLKQTGDNTNPIEVVETISGNDVSIGNVAFIDPSGKPVNFSVGETEVAELKVTVEAHTAYINALDKDVADLQIGKADVSSVETLTNTVNGKVNVAQGTGNVGKVLGINALGNVEPVAVDSGGEVWEEIDLNNIPTNWSIGDRIKVKPSIYKPSVPSTATTWTSDISGITYSVNPYRAPVIEFELDSKSASGTTFVPIHLEYNNVMFNITYIRCTLEPSKYTTSSNMFYLGAVTFNGHGLTKISTPVTSSNIRDYIVKMWRLKK